MPLRLIETSIACDIPHEEILKLFSPRFLRGEHLNPSVDERTRHLYNRLYRCVQQLARRPEAAMTRDVELVQQRFAEDIAELIPLMKHADLILRKFKPEERLADLTPAQAVLALPDEVLRGLSEPYIATLPADVQATVRARLLR